VAFYTHRQKPTQTKSQSHTQRETQIVENFLNEHKKATLLSGFFNIGIYIKDLYWMVQGARNCLGPSTEN
jgi:hypothetical protein